MEKQDYTTIQYDYDESLERSKEMGDFLVKDILSAMLFFLKYASLLYKQAEGLYGSQDEDDGVAPPR